MIEVELFKAEHLLEIEVQPAQRHEYDDPKAIGAAYERAGNAFTLRYDGRIAACAGLASSEVAGIHLWAVVAKRAPLQVLHRAARRLLSMYRGAGQVIATSEATFVQGCRWLEMLGFERMGKIRSFGGTDHVLYMRQL